MEFSLPGAVSASDAPNEGKAGLQRRSSFNTSKHRGLHAKVWENYGDGLWRVTHNFNMGLELNREASRPSSQGGHQNVHLPSVSVPALLQLRTALSQPHAIHICAPIGSQVAMNLVEEEEEDHNEVLVGQLDGVLSVEAKRELRALLAERSEEVAVQVGHIQSVKLEDLLKDEKSADHMDISICSLSGYDSTQPLKVALARLENVVRNGCAVRFAAVVLCPSGDSKKARFACEMGRALATAFMDDGFLTEANEVPASTPEHLLEAFDQYLSTMTLVPTVHMRQDPGIKEDGEAQAAPNDVLLADTLLDGMQKRIFPAERSHRTGNHGCPTPEGNWVHYFVEVDQLCDTQRQWEVTRRLRQGLELELNSDDLRPHLPHVSLDGLSRVKELMRPKSVALDVAAPDAHSAVKAAVDQLGSIGLPKGASEGISQALLDRALNGATCNPGSPVSAGRRQLQVAELVKPCAGEEACVILAMAHETVPVGSGVLGAFLRLGSPLGLSCAAQEMPTRFLLVLVGPSGSKRELQTISDSLAALAVDEDLMSSLNSVNNVNAFTGALEDRLNALILMPHAHLSVQKGPNSGHLLRGSTESFKHQNPSTQSVVEGGYEHGDGPEQYEDISPFRRKLKYVVKRIQKYSVPLVAGVILALIWDNIDSTSYYKMSHGLWFEFDLLGDHTSISLHFIVNDIFMCFFFGLAIKEVTEAVLPGGSLSPISRAANPLLATVGGIVGPIAMYVVMISIFNAGGSFDGLMCIPAGGGGGDDGHRRLGGGASVATGTPEPCPTATLIRGWGVPIATDISLAWMFALIIFGAGHPAINFLLLLAIVDDAIGVVILAIFYSNPLRPVEPLWLLLVLVAMILAGGLRVLLNRINMQFWSIYIGICGPISWLGLYKAHVHPALALVFVVPFMPATMAHYRSHHDNRRLGAVDVAPSKVIVEEVAEAMKLRRRASIVEKVVAALKTLEDAPLHTFEHHLKLPVDLGMFFFGLANAGVKMNGVGTVTVSIVVAMLLGKTLGISFFALFASAIGFKLPTGVTVADLFAMGALGGIGLTVALFMANEAFVDPGLRGQAKIGAVFSVAAAALAWLLRYFIQLLTNYRSGSSAVLTVEDEVSECVDAAWLDDLMVDDVMEVLRMQRRYQNRGTAMPLIDVARAVSKDTCRRDPARRLTR